MKFRDVFVAACAAYFGILAHAQSPVPRLSAAISGSTRTVLTGTRPAFASSGKDLGALPASTPIHGITLVFQRSAAQQADLETLMAAQQDTTSAQFHQWLTPDQFAVRFGMADADLNKVEAWLTGQGFQVESVAHSHDRLSFDGNAGQVAAAFGAELHRYQVGDAVLFGPASNLSVPAVLAPLVTDVLRLSDLHPHRQTKLGITAPKPAYTSALSGNHFLTPADLATMYDVTPTYKAGYTGTGQSLAIVGQTYINTASITAFQNGAGLPVNTPNLVLVPNTGVNAINALDDGDEAETQIDVEYAAGMAPGANIYVVYTGDSPNASVFDSLAYAVDERIAPVISGSYGICEVALNTSSGGQQLVASLNQLVQQANTQGQTIIFSAGDSGSTDCYGDTGLTSTQQVSLSADFPSTLPGITAAGGTQMAAGTYTAGTSQYWQSASGSDVLSSLLSYVPEIVWNEDSTSGLSAGGGGSSIFVSRPTWQTGVSGIPTGTQRLTPDLSLQASTDSPGYLYCTSDPSDLASSGLAATCTNGLRSSNSNFNLAGGTSFVAPTLAGMITVLNQANHATGQGNINPTLYSLAANRATYGTVFHDVTTGSNGCVSGACPFVGPAAYSAGIGYDEATGLGSIDFTQLVAAWPNAAATTLAASTTALVAATKTPALGATDAISISVSSQATGGTVPTGTVQISVDGGSVGTALPLVNGTATYTYTAPTTGVGSHVIAAAYSGDGTYAPSTGVTSVTVGSTAAAGTFTLSAAAISVPFNGSSTTSLVLTPGAGYTGTVAISLTYPTGAPTLCFGVSNPNTGGSNVPLTTGGPVTATLTIAEGTACTTTAAGLLIPRVGPATTLRHSGVSGTHPEWPEGIALAGLVCVGFGFRRSRRVPAVLGLLMLAGIGLGLSGCGGGAGATDIAASSTTPQTYTVTVAGSDSLNSSIGASTSVAVTVH